MSLRVKDVMTADPVTLSPSAGYKEMVDKLVDHDVGGLPVVDDDGVLVGIVTESDLLTKPANGQRRERRSVIKTLLGKRRPAWVSKATGLTCEEIMSDDVLTAVRWERTDAVARRLVENRIGRLPVVDDDGVLVGIVSQRDLLRQFHRPDEEISALVGAALHDPVLFEQGHAVTFSVGDGIVALTGTVPYPRDLPSVEAAVRAVPGVVEVHNEVTAERPDPEPEPGHPGPYDDPFGKGMIKPIV